MQKFIRGNDIVCSGKFIPASGTTQPATAVAKLSYKTLAGTPATSSVTLTKDANNIWSGVWDSTAAGDGYVDWVIQCNGGLHAASQGTFYLQANSANT